MTVVWSIRAVRHLQHLRDHIARERPRAARDVAAAILAAVSLLAEHPGLGRPGRVGGTRELVVPGTPYPAAYRLRADRLEVVAVFHGRRKWPRRL